MPGLRQSGGVLLVACYELGQQPLSLARAAAFLARAGFEAACLDLSRDEPSDDALRRARLIAVAVPMHAALRIGVRFSARARSVAPAAHLCFFGLYASLTAEQLLIGAADSILGGETEDALVALAEALDRGVSPKTVRALRISGREAAPVVARLSYPALRRNELPDLERYVRLDAGGELLVTAAVEASRGCRHECRHCPIPAVYGGRFFAIPADTVLADIRDAVQRGARHITFADPDFLNGPTHALAVARRLHAEHPQLTFDVTAKVAHLLRHAALLSELVSLGCLFAVTAVESLSDRVLGILDKGHTRQDVSRLLGIARQANLTLRPTLLPFTPWSTRNDLKELLDWIDEEELTECVDPVQLSVRLLVPPSSLLEHHPEMLPHLLGPDPASFCIAWRHPDPVMDRLHALVSGAARQGAIAGDPAWLVYRRVRRIVDEAMGSEASQRERIIRPALDRARPPRLTEPWFC